MNKVTFPLFVLIVFITCVGIAQTQSSFIKVDNTTKQYTDSTGRTRLFHGVNAVYKIPPWHPELETFNTEDSLCATDIQYLQEWGFTVVRLGVMWPGVSISQNSYNQTYLQTMLSLVTALGESGIYTIVDCHQDVFSRYFCGEGAPDWAVPKEVTLEFPSPVRPPSSMSYDPNTGYPNISTCLESNFFSYYKASAVAEAFQKLYENSNGLQDEFIKFWEQVATTFKDSPYVLGYELINEPWKGNPFRHPKVELPGYADKTFLFPMYQNIANAIRQIDNEHIIFFEAAISDKFECGFTEGPNGPAYDDRQAYSYHVYCGSTDSNGDPIRPTICNLTDYFIFDIKKADYERMGLAGFITEFGALQGTPEGVDLVHYITGKADENLQSWAYWQYKFNADLTTQSQDGAESFWINGTLDFAKVKALSRTYAQAIAGTLVTHYFDPLTAYFQLQFEVVSGLTSNITEIYYNPQYYYPKGYQISMTEGLSQLSNSPSPYLIQIDSSNVVPGTIVEVLIIPNL